MTTLAQVQAALAPTQDSGGGVYNDYEDGRNSWGVLNGKLWTTPGANVPADVMAAFPHVTPQEFSDMINEDGPGNGAGKGSMKEGILSAAKFALAAYGAGNLIGGASGAPSITDKIQNFFTPATTSAPMQLADAGNIMTDVSPGYGGEQLAFNGPFIGDELIPPSMTEMAQARAAAGLPAILPPVPSGGASAGKDSSSFLDKAGSSLLSGAAAAGAGALIGKAFTPGTSDGGLSAAADAQAAEQDRKAVLRKKINQLYGIDDGTDDPVAKAARDSMAAEENKLGGATKDFYSEQLQHDTDKAFRENRFALADRGTLGGSAQIDTEKELSRDNTLGATRIGDQVANAISGLKSSREQERLNATSLVNSGSGEDAVKSAQAGLTRSLENANATQHASITGDLFTGGANSVASANAGYNPLLLAQYQNRLGSFFNSGGGASAKNTPTG